MSRLIGNSYIAGGTVMKASGTFTSNPQTTSANVMIVAGGGGGAGYHTAPGGGAGGLVYYKDTPLSANTDYTVVVGAGGAASIPSNMGPPGAAGQMGNDGSDSSFASLTTAVGGGGGGVGGGPATAGGSGGGSLGWGPWAPAGYTAGTGTTNQGTAGSTGNSPSPAGYTLVLGAGGGAGGAGGARHTGWGGVVATDGSTTVYDHEGSSPETLNIGTSKSYAGGGGGAIGGGDRTAIPDFPEAPGYMYIDMGRYRGGNGYGFPGIGGGGSGAFKTHPADDASYGAPPSGYPAPARSLNAGWGDTNTGGGGGGGTTADGGAPQANPFWDGTHPYAPSPVPSDLSNVSRGGAGGSGVVVIREPAVSGGVWNIKQQYKQMVDGTWSV